MFDGKGNGWMEHTNWSTYLKTIGKNIEYKYFECKEKKGNRIQKEKAKLIFISQSIVEGTWEYDSIFFIKFMVTGNQYSPKHDINNMQWHANASFILFIMQINEKWEYAWLEKRYVSDKQQSIHKDYWMRSPFLWYESITNTIKIWLMMTSID